MEKEKIPPVIEDKKTELCCSPKNQLIFKILVIILCLLIVIGLFLNAYLLLNKKDTKSDTSQPIAVTTPTPDLTENWKTYTNTEYGFTFKHPNLKELTNTGYLGGSRAKLIVDMQRDSNSITGIPSDGIDSLLIDVSEIDVMESFELYVSKQPKNNYILEKESEITIDGRKGIIQKLQNEESYLYFVQIPNTNKILTIHRRNSSENVFNLFLSTFKFTNQAIDTTNWKTFSSDFGFSLKTPQNFVILGTGMYGEEPQNKNSIRISSEGGNLDEPHMNIVILEDSSKDLKVTAQENYDKNINEPFMPASIKEQIKEKLFLGTKSYEYTLQNKGADTPTEGYLGYEGLYKFIWTEKFGKQFLIVYTITSEFDQILSTFKFTN